MKEEIKNLLIMLTITFLICVGVLIYDFGIGCLSVIAWFFLWAAKIQCDIDIKKYECEEKIKELEKKD